MLLSTGRISINTDGKTELYDISRELVVQLMGDQLKQYLPWQPAQINRPLRPFIFENR
jgi:hypothetical protein